jgi:hypothetical protein
VAPDASPLRNSEHRELYLSGLRLAASQGDDDPLAPQKSPL